MIVTNFIEDYSIYENMVIWEVKSLDDFFKTHESMKEIFEVEYGFPPRSIDSQEDFRDSDVLIVSKLLSHFGDKHFFVFADNDPHHNQLKQLQDQKVIHFGLDIYVVNPSRIYVLEMDRTSDISKYDR